MSKKRLSEKELLDGITPDTAHADELATVPWDELGTPEGDKLEKLVTWVEAYEEEHFPF